jgi:hypothetical protein
MWPPLFRNAIRALGFSALVGAAAGCSAGYPPTESDSEAARTAQSKHERAVRDVSPETEDLEADLFRTDAGKVLVRSLRAHGGWDYWLGLTHVVCNRSRIVPEERQTPGPGAEGAGKGGAPGEATPGAPRRADETERKDSIEIRIDPVHFRFETSLPPSPRAFDLPEEVFLLCVPFLFADARFRKEYLGIEADAKTGESFEKVRCFREDLPAEEWAVAFFDRSTWYLKRLLHRDAEGKFTLTLLSDWKDLGGIRIPAKRSIYLLEGLFGHREMGRPDYIDVLSDLHVVD